MTFDEDYTFEDKLIWLGEICRLKVMCGSYGDKFERYNFDGPYVEYEDHLKHIHIRDEEIKRLRALLTVGEECQCHY